MKGKSMISSYQNAWEVNEYFKIPGINYLVRSYKNNFFTL